MNSRDRKGQKKSAISRDMGFDLNLDQVCLCSVEAIKTLIFYSETYVKVIFLLLVSVFNFLPLTDENHLLLLKLFSSLLDQLLAHCSIMVYSRGYWKRKFLTWGLLSNLENSTKMYFTWRPHNPNVAQALGKKNTCQ